MDLKYHLTDDSDTACKYQLIDCPMKCGNLYERKDIGKHVASDCTHRKVHCEHCGSSVTFCLMGEHYSECEQFPVSCPLNCGKLIRRSDSAYHESEECKNRTIPCLFQDVGCKAIVKQEDFESHVHECKEKYLIKAHKEVLLEMQSLKEEVSQIKADNQFLHSEIASLYTGLKVSHENAEFLRQESCQLKSVLLNEIPYLHTMAKPCETLSIDCIKTHLQGQVVYLVPGGDSATFRITEYSVYKKKGDVWYSPSFYIAEGYKFCLAIYVNGMGAGKGTHLAVYLHQRVGQFDSHLTWPFSLEEDLEIRVMRQEQIKESKMSLLFKGAGNTASPPRSRTEQSESHFSSFLKGNPNKSPSQTLTKINNSPVLSSRSASLLRNVPFENVEYDNVAECQIMTISKVLNQPTESSLSLDQSVNILELFCLQKTVDSVVFIDSVVIQCRLIFNQRNSHSPISLTDNIVWKKWIS